MSELRFWRRFASRDSQAVPVGTFLHCPGAVDFDSNILEDLIFEAPHEPIDTPGTTVYWLAKIVRVFGYFVIAEWLLETDTSRRFWVNIAAYENPSENQVVRAYPVGWARANNRRLGPPQRILDIENWKNLIHHELVDKHILADGFHEIVEAENECSFRPGMRMEVQAIDRITAVRVAEVVGHVGRRMKLRYVEGTPQPRFCHFHEFDNEMIMACGSARVFGRESISSREYWDASMTKFTSFNGPSDRATRICFKPMLVPETTAESLSRKQFRVGAKLELLDPLAPEYISVGTIRKLLPNQFLEISVDGAVGPDGGEHRVFVHATSPVLLPAGFAQGQLGQNFMEYFHPPHAGFSFGNHETVPRELFMKHFIPHGFAPGRFLLAIGVSGTDLLYLARVLKVVGHLVLIHFEGYPSSEDQFFPMTSPNLYPVGWADLVGHPIITPLAARALDGNGGRRRGAGRPRRESARVFVPN